MSKNKLRFQFIQNKRTLFTRMCIGEAVVDLMKKAELQQLKILDVVKRAGISRMTFYKYYPTTQAALEDYLNNIIAGYLEEAGKQENSEAYLTYEHILFALKYFDRYRKFFLTIKARGLDSLLINSVNAFVTEHIHIEDEELSRYVLYSYGGGLLNAFLMWEMNGRTESAEEVAKMIYRLYGRGTLPHQFSDTD